MRFETSQQMKLGQQMKLAPRMIQSMEILQLPLLALQERIEQELESNVTLEQVAPESEPGDRVEASEREGDERDLEVTGGAEDFERLDAMERDYEEAFENEYSASRLKREMEALSPGSGSGGGERDAKMEAMAATAARSASLSDQLLDQWRLAETTPRARELGELLLAHLDGDGYLRTALADIADQAPAAIEKPSEEELEAALGELQNALDPPGVAARDTRECLLLQLDAHEREGTGVATPLVRRLVEKHLDDLLNNRLPKIAEEEETSIDAVKDAMVRMRRLSVAPARMLVSDTPAAIVPDAIIEYDEEEDRYVGYLNDAAVPNLRINKSYAKMVRDEDVDKGAKDFIRTNLSNAQWLIDAIEQRKRTLVRVLNVVAAAQRDYFDQGPEALRPLPMTQVADQLGVHVATVSRAVSGKHVRTPRGTVALRKFFSGGIQTEEGEEMSWEAIRAALREVVDAEDKSKPLSDEALSKALKARGIDIARRTVAKYRDQLGIPAARLRKEY
jgi:RNA polymerase sigma-54 factor